MINWYLETKRSQRDKKERNKDRKKWQSPLKSSEAVRCTKGKRALIDAGSSFFLCLCRWYLWVQTKKLCSVFEFFWNSSIAFYKTSISEILNTKLPLCTFSASQASPQSLLLWFTHFNTFGKRWDQCHQPHLMKRQPSQKVTVSDDNSYQSCKNETFCIQEVLALYLSKWMTLIKSMTQGQQHWILTGFLNQREAFPSTKHSFHQHFTNVWTNENPGFTLLVTLKRSFFPFLKIKKEDKGKIISNLLHILNEVRLSLPNSPSQP